MSPSTGDGEEMQRLQDNARRIAADAGEMAEQSRPSALTGTRPELRPEAAPALDLRGSAAIRHGEQVRARDDVETSERQQEMAAGQEAAAAALQRSAERLDAGRERLQGVRERVEQNAQDAASLAQDADHLSAQVDQLRNRARSLQVDGDGDRDRQE